ncbi:MAG TPA: SGNH/GDSL hydrolase family protein [Acidimicrobiales bacterium]|nr:SGNH/GDSL hydrolase family protein [Acidimicrobiales bacterium]
MIIAGAVFYLDAAPIAAVTGGPKTLLALGDSLAAGYQPTDGSRPPPSDPATGYPDVGYPASYAADIAQARGLNLFDLGCPGETSSSMLSTPAEPACSSLYRHELSASSQLAAAGAFLDHHRGQVAVVTLDIGANDVDHCISSSNVNARCIATAEVNFEKNYFTIVKRLKATLKRDDPSARLVTMNYYDPFLALAFRPGGSEGGRLADESLLAVNAFNTQILGDAHLFGIALADVARAFQVNSTLPMVRYAGRKLPQNVASTCELTWMCPLRSSARPDIHPNNVGYSTIASAFEHLLSRTG